jgi:hypothetical protein
MVKMVVCNDKRPNVFRAISGISKRLENATGSASTPTIHKGRFISFQQEHP